MERTEKKMKQLRTLHHEKNRAFNLLQADFKKKTAAYDTNLKTLERTKKRNKYQLRFNNKR